MFTRHKPSNGTRALALSLVFSHLTTLVAPALANPQGGVVASGSATISAAGSVTTINQGTDRAIINWQSFSNAAGETIRFQQPAPSSVALNRVTGGDPSKILGTVEANGRLFLLNPNGVVFGRGSQVRVNALVASTLSMSDRDFNSGNYRLSHDPSTARGAVVNQGRIEAEGGVALIGPIVNNSGHIVANRGVVTLAGTSRAVVNFDQQGLLNVVVPAGPSDRGDVTVAPGGSSELLERVATAPGVVEAGEIVRTADGRTILKHSEGLAINEGTIVARGGNGNGGSVRIHGTQGAVLASGSLIDVNGAGTGHGGNVHLTSHRTAITMAGSRILARGGEQGGNGGFVDQSAPRVVVQASVDTRGGAGGRTGMFLIDPDNIHVIDAAAGGNDDAQIVPDGLVLAGENPGSDFTISDAQINLTGATTDIQLAATNTIDFSGTVDINIPNDISFTSANFTMTGGDSITANSITVAATGNVVLGTLTGTGAGIDSIAVTTTGGTINTVTAILANAGNINISSSGALTVNNIVVASAGSLNLASTAGAVTINRGVAGNSVTIGAAQALVVNDTVDSSVGAVSLSAGTNLTTNGGGAVFGKSAATLTAANDLSVFASVTADTGAAMLTATNGILSVNAGVNGNTVTGLAGTSLLLTNTVTTDVGAVSLTAGTVMNVAGAITSATGVTLAATAGTLDVVNTVTGSNGTVSLTAGGPLNINQTVTGNAVTGSAGGALTVSGPVIARSTSVSLMAGTDLTVTGAGPIDARAGVSLTAAQNLTLNGEVTGGNGAVSLTATNAGLTINQIVSGGSVTGIAGTVVDVNNVVDARSTTAMLTAGTNLTVSGSGSVAGRTGVTLTGTNNLTLNGAANSPVGTVTLAATNAALAINAPVNGRNVSGNAGTVLNVDGTVTATTGTVGLTAGTDLNVGGAGPITAQTGVTLTAGSNLTANGAVTSSSGLVSLAAQSAVLTINRVVTGGSVTGTAGTVLNVNNPVISSAGAVSLTAGTDLNVSSPVTAQTDAVLTATNGTLSLSNNVTSLTGSLNFTSQATLVIPRPFAAPGDIFVRSVGGDVVVNSALTADGDSSGVGGVSLLANGQIVINNPIVGAAVSGTAGSLLSVNSTVSANTAAVNLTAQGGDLGVFQSIFGATGVTLTASNALTLASPVTAANGAVMLTATGAALTINAVVAGDTVTGTAGSTVSVNNAVVADVGGVSLTGVSNLTASSPITARGNVALAATGGDVVVSNPITADSDENGVGTASMTASGQVLINREVVGAAVTGNAGGGLVVSNTVSARTGAVNLTSGTDLTVAREITGEGGVSLTAANNLTVSNEVTAPNGAVTLTATGGALAIQSDVSGDSVTGTAGSNVQVNGVVTSDVGAVALTAATDLTVSQPITGQTDVTLLATTGSLALMNTVTAVTGSLSLTSQNTLNVPQTLSAPGSISVVSTGGDVTINGSVTADSDGNGAGTATLTAAGVLDIENPIVAAAVTGTAGLVLVANSTITANTGAVILSAGTDLTVTAAATTVGATDVSLLANGVLAVNAPVRADNDANGSGNLTLQSSGGTVAVNAAVGGANAVVSGLGDVTLAAPLTTAGTADLRTGAIFSQTPAGNITASTLVLSTNGPAGTGDFALANTNNLVSNVGTFGQIRTLAFLDANGFDVTGISAGVSVMLQSDGTVSQTGGITTPALTLSGAATTSFLLAGANNDATLIVPNAVNVFEFRDDNGFVMPAITASTSAAFVTNGTVTQSGAISTGTLTLGGSTAGQGTFVLNTQANAVNTLSTRNQAGGIAFRNASGLVIQGVSVAGAFDLLAAGSVSDVGTSGLTAGSAQLDVGAANDVGSAANLFDTTVGTLHVMGTGASAGARNVFVNELDSLAIGTIVTDPAGTVRVDAGGSLSLGLINTGTFTLATGGSILDANLGAINLQSTGAGRISITGPATIAGALADPIDLSMGGALTVNLVGQVSGISGVFAGTAPGVVIEAAPGLVIFNGKDLRPPPAPTVNPAAAPIAAGVGAPTIALGQGAATVRSTFQSRTAQRDLIEISKQSDQERVGELEQGSIPARPGKPSSYTTQEDEERKKRKAKVRTKRTAAVSATPARGAASAKQAASARQVAQAR